MDYYSRISKYFLFFSISLLPQVSKVIVKLTINMRQYWLYIFNLIYIFLFFNLFLSMFDHGYGFWHCWGQLVLRAGFSPVCCCSTTSFHVMVTEL